MKNKVNQIETAKKALMFSGASFLSLGSILVIVLIFLAINVTQQFDGPRNTISVSGEAEVLAKPDIAVINFTIQERGKEVKDVEREVTEKVSVITNGLENIGIDEKDIKTTSFSVTPEYEYVKLLGNTPQVSVEGLAYIPPQRENRVQTGFIVSQNITVKVRDIDDTGSVLSLINEQNAQHVNGPNFTIDDEDALQEEARSMAIKDARQKAEQIAKDLGTRLGKVVSFNEGGFYPYFETAVMNARIAEADSDKDVASPILPTGENIIYSNVTVVYELK